MEVQEWIGCSKKTCPRVGKCRYWGKTPHQIVSELLKEIKGKDYLWKRKGSFVLSTNGCFAADFAFSKRGTSLPWRIKEGEKQEEVLLQVYCPDINRKALAVKPLDWGTIGGDLHKEDPEVQRLFRREIDRFDVHRLVCYWFEKGKDYGRKLDDLHSALEVHHEDGCKLNNSLSNLFPLRKHEHKWVGKKDGIPLKKMIGLIKSETTREVNTSIRLEESLKQARNLVKELTALQTK